MPQTPPNFRHSSIFAAADKNHDKRKPKILKQNSLLLPFAKHSPRDFAQPLIQFSLRTSPTGAGSAHLYIASQCVLSILQKLFLDIEN